MTQSTPPARRLALVAGLLVAVLMSCGRELTSPATAPVNAFKRFAAVAFSPQYETAARGTALQAALTQVAFERVRITLRRVDGTIALDTVVTFSAGLDSLVLSLTVSLPASTSASGAPLSLNLGYVNAAGDTVFKGGPITVMALPSTGGGTPPPVQVPVRYTGIGSNATAVSIAPRIATGIAGQSAPFTAQALSSTGQVIAGTPIVFSSSDPGVVRIANPSSGSADFIGRGSAFVYALLLTGQKDSAVVTVTLPATAIALVSGGNQTANAGSTLPQPVVAQVRAVDGVGVAGVTVTFAVASGAGVITPASAVSGANGQVSTSWKLGPTAGPQSMTATTTGLTGSPITVNATALAIVPSKLVMTTAPTNGTAGSALSPVAVTAQDALGNTATAFTGDVSVAIGNNPGSATLGGTTTVKAVAGVATFPTLTLNRPGTAYTLTFTSSGLVGITSSTFDVTAGSAAKLVFRPVPGAVDAGLVIVPALQVMAQDADGNSVTSFTGNVTVAIGTNPGASTLSGTLTRAAVAGIATFNDLSLNRKGPSYTLVASAAGLASGTSTPFSVAPGAAVALGIVSGNAQTKPAGSLLSPIAVRLHDALNNSIEGASIAFAVTGGGGTLSAPSAVTDSSGTASVSWTIGSGPQTMTATYAGLPAITITATSTSAVLVWTGATSSDWLVAANWSGGSVPISTDDVLIPASAAVNPRINNVYPNPTTYGRAHHLTIESGKSIRLGCGTQLRVTGNVVAPLDAAAVQTCEGDAMNLMGDGAALGNTVVGKFDEVTVSSDYRVSGTGSQLIVTYDLIIDGSGNLTVNGGRVDANALKTTSDATFTMTNTADQVFARTAFFGGSSTAGRLTAGTLTITNGALSSGSDYFAPSGTHTVVFAGSNNSVTFGDPVNSFFQNVTVNDGTTLSVETNNLSYPNFGFNANGTLSRGPGTVGMVITSPSMVRINNVAGLNITGGPTTFENIGMRLVLGTTNATLNAVTFTGFLGYLGPILRVMRNSPEIITFNALDFSAVTGLSAGGVFLDNSNTATVNIRASNPGTGVLGTQYTITGTGTVSWIP